MLRLKIYHAEVEDKNSERNNLDIRPGEVHAIWARTALAKVLASVLAGRENFK